MVTVGAAMNNEKRPAGPSVFVEVDRVAELVGQHDVGKALTEARTEGIGVDLRNR